MILGDKIKSIYLYGSVPMNDFQLGCSDIDILCLIKEPFSDSEAEQLTSLRQTLLQKDPINHYYLCFEGAIAVCDEFIKNQYSRVVYWGTSGQRIDSRSTLSAIV